MTAACAMLLPALLVAAEGNLLRNPSFEDTDAATGAAAFWRTGDWGPKDQAGTVTIKPGEEAPADGQRVGQLIYDGQGDRLVLWQDVPRRDTTKFRLTLQFRAPESVTCSASAVTFRANSQANLDYHNSKALKGNGAWQTIELAFETSPEAATIRVILRASAAAAFDDVALVPLGAEAQTEPSNAQELATKTTDSAAGVDAFDAARKAKMSPEELAWEKVLEENLGGFYLPGYKEAKAKGHITAWDYVKDDPALPRVLLIGDSISRGYTVATRNALAGKVNVHRAPENCGPTTNGLKKLDIWLGDGQWDLIVFNFGIHDRNSATDQYVARLEEIIGRLKQTGAKLLWVTSTPLPAGSDMYKQGEEVRLNTAAAELMAKHGIPINDLYAVAVPVLDVYQNPGDCHFSEAGYRLFGEVTASRILKALGDQTP